MSFSNPGAGSGEKGLSLCDCTCPVGFLVEDGAKGSGRQRLPVHGWHSPAGLGTALELLCCCPSARNRLLQNASFVANFFVWGVGGMLKWWHYAAQAAAKMPSEQSHCRKVQYTRLVLFSTETKTFSWKSPSSRPLSFPQIYEPLTCSGTRTPNFDVTGAARRISNKNLYLNITQYQQYTLLGAAVIAWPWFIENKHMQFV